MMMIIVVVVGNGGCRPFGFGSNDRRHLGNGNWVGTSVLTEYDTAES